MRALCQARLDWFARFQVSLLVSLMRLMIQSTFEGTIGTLVHSLPLESG